jgi:hypothetical protein
MREPGCIPEKENLMAADFEPGKKNPPKPRAALTLKTKSRIRELVGKCEYCDRASSPGLLRVYQLCPLVQPEYRKETSPVNAVIVLCEVHYNQVLGGQIPKSSLKAKIAQRPDKRKKELRSVLQKQERTSPEFDITKSRDPSLFTVFPPDQNGRRR